MIDYKTTRAGDQKDILVLEVAGRLDNETSDFLFNAVEGEIEDGNRKIIIDLQQLDSISSLGIGTLVRIHSRMSGKGGDVRFAHVQGVVADVIQSVRLNDLFHFYPTVTDAVAALEQ